MRTNSYRYSHLLLETGLIFFFSVCHKKIIIAIGLQFYFFLLLNEFNNLYIFSFNRAKLDSCSRACIRAFYV